MTFNALFSLHPVVVLFNFCFIYCHKFSSETRVVVNQFSCSSLLGSEVPVVIMVHLQVMIFEASLFFVKYCVEYLLILLTFILISLFLERPSPFHVNTVIIVFIYWLIICQNSFKNAFQFVRDLMPAKQFLLKRQHKSFSGQRVTKKE